MQLILYFYPYHIQCRLTFLFSVDRPYIRNPVKASTFLVAQKTKKFPLSKSPVMLKQVARVVTNFILGENLDTVTLWIVKIKFYSEIFLFDNKTNFLSTILLKFFLNYFKQNRFTTPIYILYV